MKVKICPLAKKHHDISPRQFAHVFHERDTICVAPEFCDLPKAYQVGILIHEFGHIQLRRNLEHSEREADNVMYEMYGIRIDRKNYRGKKNLEYIGKRYMPAALEFLLERFTA